MCEHCIDCFFRDEDGDREQATVFSGIGAIEQTLLRTHIAHEIVFACDNGDLSPFICNAVKWEECVSLFKTLSESVDRLQPTTEKQKDAAEIVIRLRDSDPLINARP